jgi:signal peptidase I
VSDGDDLRLRLEAQVAAKRDARAQSLRRTGKRRSSSSGPAGPGGAGGPGGPGESAGSGSSPGFLHTVLRFVIVLIIAVGFATGLREWVVQPFWIPSQSMEPTLHGCPGCNPDRLLVDKLSYHLHSIHRGDVVVFSRPPDADITDANLVKRVIGLPGEVVRGANGTVYINNRVLTEPYIAPACHGTADFPPVTVPAGHVFVMGDNRCDSFDSRRFGPIPTSSIIGRAFVIVWPLARFHWL